MAEFKIVISDPKSRKAYQKEVDQAASGFLGKKIGEKVSASSLGLEGYSLEVTGGSDKDGFPMRSDVGGSARKRILIAQPPGFHPKKKGQRKRKSICGNTVSATTTQINTKVVEYGKKSIEELLGKKEEKKGEAKEGEKPKEEPKKPAEEKKQEPKKEEKAPEKPKEEPKKEEKPVEKKEKTEEKKKEEKPKESKKEEPAEEKAETAEKKMGVKKLED